MQQKMHWMDMRVVGERGRETVSRGNCKEEHKQECEGRAMAMHSCRGVEQGKLKNKARC